MGAPGFIGLIVLLLAGAVIATWAVVGRVPEPSTAHLFHEKDHTVVLPLVCVTSETKAT